MGDRSFNGRDEHAPPILEGPACRVRCTTLDYPFRFGGHDGHAPPNGHDKRAPPTSPSEGPPVASVAPLDGLAQFPISVANHGRIKQEVSW